MPNYVVGGRRYPQWRYFDGDAIKWNQGEGGSPPPVNTHKPLFHNQYYYDGLSGVILWQNAGSGSGPTPPTPGNGEYIIFARQKHRR